MCILKQPDQAGNKKSGDYFQIKESGIFHYLKSMVSENHQ